MWESIVLTVVATAGNNIGKILQKKGTVILPPLSFKFKASFSFLNSDFFFPFSYAHDLFPLQNLTFGHNYSISSIRICFSLMWMYLKPETYNLRGLFVGMMKLGTCTWVCMNVGFWVQDILVKMPFFIE